MGVLCLPVWRSWAVFPRQASMSRYWPPNSKRTLIPVFLLPMPNRHFCRLTSTARTSYPIISGSILPMASLYSHSVTLTTPPRSSNMAGYFVSLPASSWSHVPALSNQKVAVTMSRFKSSCAGRSSRYRGWEKDKLYLFLNTAGHTTSHLLIISFCWKVTKFKSF